MYPVSEAYKSTIKADVINDKITGVIKLIDDTVINVTQRNIYDGTLYLSEACISGGDIEIGSVIVNELGFALVDSPNPYNLDGARIELQYGLETSPGIWEYVPLGVYYADNPKCRLDGGVALKAYDNMIRLDKDIEATMSASLPYSIIAWICAQTGVPLASTALQIAALANGETTLSMPSDAPIKTYRDLLMWVCQATCSFARCNRSTGGLELVSVQERTVARTIDYTDQYDGTDISDNYVKITSVQTVHNGIKISVGSGISIMELDENPLWVNKEQAEVLSLLQNILDRLTTAEYTPSKVVYVGDPALQPGDYITVKRSRDDTEPVTMYLTSSIWRHYGKHILVSDGESALRKNSYNQSAKNVSNIKKILEATKQIAESAGYQADLLNGTINGNVLIRQTPGEKNEILIMDHPNPALAVKIWRWNMSGLGYSDNVIGADNPARLYTLAITMDGAISANFITTGVLRAILLEAVEINCNDKFTVSADGTVTAVKGNIGGWKISEQGLTARDTTDIPTPAVIAQVGIQEDIINGGWYYEAKTGYDRYTYVFDLTLYRQYTITYTGIADKAILTNEYPPTDVPPVRTPIYSFADHDLDNPIPDTNEWGYLAIDTDDPAFTVSINAAAPSEDTSGMLSSGAAKGHAQIVMGVEASMPSPKFIGQSKIRHFAGKSPGETPGSNADVPFYVTETGFIKANGIQSDGGYYSEGPDGKYVFIKDGKIIFGDKNTRNIFEISLVGLLQKYFYGAVEMPGFKVDLHYGYPTSYGDISNANIT